MHMLAVAEMQRNRASTVGRGLKVQVQPT